MYLLEDVEVDYTLGSLSRSSEFFWFKTSLDQHNACECMYLFRMYCIRGQFAIEDHTVMITFSNVWNLLKFWLFVSSDYNMQAMMDVTHKCSTAAVEKHSIRVNMLGGKCSKAVPLSSPLSQHKLNLSRYTLRVHCLSTFQPYCEVCSALPALYHRQTRIAHQPLSVIQLICVPKLHEKRAQHQG